MLNMRVENKKVPLVINYCVRECGTADQLELPCSRRFPAIKISPKKTIGGGWSKTPLVAGVIDFRADGWNRFALSDHQEAVFEGGKKYAKSLWLVTSSLQTIKAFRAEENHAFLATQYPLCSADGLAAGEGLFSMISRGGSGSGSYARKIWGPPDFSNRRVFDGLEYSVLYRWKELTLPVARITNGLERAGLNTGGMDAVSPWALWTNALAAYHCWGGEPTIKGLASDSYDYADLSSSGYWSARNWVNYNVLTWAIPKRRWLLYQ